jgi:hypothetical protein
MGRAGNNDARNNNDAPELLEISASRKVLVDEVDLGCYIEVLPYCEIADFCPGALFRLLTDHGIVCRVSKPDTALWVAAFSICICD